MTKTIAVRLSLTPVRQGDDTAFGDPTELPLDDVAGRIASGQAKPYVPIEAYEPEIPLDGLSLADAFTVHAHKHPDIERYQVTPPTPGKIRTKPFFRPLSWESVADTYRLRQKAGLQQPRSPVYSTWLNSEPVRPTSRGVVVYHGELVEAIEQAVSEFAWCQILQAFFAKLAAGDLLTEGVAEVDIYEMKTTPISKRWWSRDIVVHLRSGEIWEPRGDRRWSDIKVVRDQRSQTDTDQPARSGAAGRPSSMHYVEPEFERRAQSGLMKPTLKQEAATLEKWLKATHPRAPSLKAKSIENRLRARYRQLQPRSNSSRRPQN